MKTLLEYLHWFYCLFMVQTLWFILDKPKTNHETFSYKEGDTTLCDAEIFLVMLKRANREHLKKRR